MTGMILAGVSPLEAVQLQMVVMFMLLAATSVSVLLAVELGTARLFNKNAQLVASAPQSKPWTRRAVPRGEKHER